MRPAVRNTLLVGLCFTLLCILLSTWSRRSYHKPIPGKSVRAVISGNDQETSTRRPNNIDAQLSDLTDPLLLQAKRFFSPEDNRAPWLTLCTTMADIPAKRSINENTLLNWALFRPWVRAILYVTDDSSARMRQAVSLGWTVRRVPKTRLGVPLLRSIFQDAINASDTPFYGYANGDMLFSWDILQTLELLHRGVVSRDPNESFLLVGIRTNVLTSKILLPAIPINVPEMAAVGEAFSPDAEDYFITTRHGLPWHDIPDLVIGRPIYDNWLVAMAIHWNATVVDGSGTITAVHQTGEAGNTEGSQHANTDMNRDLVPGFTFRDVKRGFTICAPYKTVYNNTRLTLVQRSVFPDACKGIEQQHTDSFAILIIACCIVIVLVNVFLCRFLGKRHPLKYIFP